MQTPCELRPKGAIPGLKIDGTIVRCSEVPRGGAYGRFHGYEGCQEHWWELVDESTGVSIRETIDTPWARFAIFWTPRLFSPEAFIALDIQPGQRQQWQRHFTFSHV